MSAASSDNRPNASSRTARRLAELPANAVDDGCVGASVVRVKASSSRRVQVVLCFDVEPGTASDMEAAIRAATGAR